MHLSLINGTAIVALYAVILVLRTKLSSTREKEARREAVIGTAVLAIVLGVSFADEVALIWPNRGQWQSAMLNVSGNPVCIMAANLGRSSFVFSAGGDGRLRIGIADKDFPEPMTNETLAMTFMTDSFQIKEITAPLATAAAPITLPELITLFNAISSSRVASIRYFIIDENAPDDGLKVDKTFPLLASGLDAARQDFLACSTKGTEIEMARNPSRPIVRTPRK